MKINSLPNAVIFLSAMAPAALAQNTPSNIVSTNETTGTTRAAVPAPVAAALPTSKRPMLEVSFEDVEVAQLINIIAKQFELQVVVSGDVSGKISSINLTNKTPEMALRAVVSAANLKYRKQEDGTYLIGKTLADDDTPANGRIQPRVSTFDNAQLPGLTEDEFTDSRANSEINIPSLIGSGNLNRPARKRQHTIRIRNVPPQLMAHWLDPARNPPPIQLQASDASKKNYSRLPIAVNAVNSADRAGQENGNVPAAEAFSGSNAALNPYLQRGNGVIRSSNAQFGQGGQGGQGGAQGGVGGAGGAGAAIGGTFELPADVDRIVAIDPQNALLVFGTDEGVRELQEIINFLDRPLRQVEIEAQFVTVNTGDRSEFGIDFSASRSNFVASSNTGSFAGSEPGGVIVGYVGPSFSATLQALISQNRAKVITAPRVTALNNLTASLLDVTRSPVVLTSISQNINGNQAVEQRLFYISTSIGLTVTPTINNDDTITVLMLPILETPRFSGLIGFATVPLISQQRLETTANVRDGDTIVLGGLRSASISRGQSKIPILGDLPLIGGVFRTRAAANVEQELIIFLTARIVRRAGDDGPVPGT